MEEVIQKPWGCEVIWAKTDSYVGKLLFVKAGHKLSLQYHERKEETLLIDKGRVKIHWFEEGDTVASTQIFMPGEVFHVPPGMKHRIEALESSCVIEVSTPELDDVVRVEDDYGRINGEENE